MYKKHIRVIAFLGIVICSLFYAFKDVSVDAILQALNSANYIYIVAAVFIVSISYVFRAMRWKYIIAFVKDVRTIDLLSPLIIGFMGNMLPARAGEFIRAYLLSKKEDIRYSASFATVFIERLFDLLITLLMLLWVLLYETEIFMHGQKEANSLAAYVVKFGWISFAACAFILLFSVFLQYKNDLAMRVLSILVRPLPVMWAEKVKRLVSSFTDGLQIIRDKRGFWGTVLLSVIITVLIAFAYYLLYLAFNIKIMHVLTSLIILNLAIDIFGVLLPTPGLIGSFHAACVAVLYGIFDIPKATALSYGIVAWLVMIGFVVVAGALLVVKDNISFGELKTCKEQRE